MGVGARAELLGNAPGDIGQAYRVAADVDRVGVELGEVEEVDGELRQPVDLLAHRANELGPCLRVGVFVLEQLDEPDSEKIGVRSSCEALAMNSLRALSRRRGASASR